MKATIYLVRHGQTEWNVQGLLQGATDVPLNETGKEQARELGSSFKDISFSSAYSSDLSRAHETAQLILEGRELEVKKSPLLRETHFGHQEGKSFNELYAVAGQSQLLQMLDFFDEILEKHPDENVLVVSHGGVIRRFLIHLGVAKGWEDVPYLKNGGYVVVDLHKELIREGKSTRIDLSCL